MTMLDLKILYSVEDVQQALSLSRSTIDRFIRSGRLKTVKVGRSVRVTRSALDEFVASFE